MVTKINPIAYYVPTSFSTVVIYFNAVGPKQGDVTVTCDGEAWTYFWGAMTPNLSAIQFFCDVTAEYVAGKLFRGKKFKKDYKDFSKYIQAKATSMQENGELPDCDPIDIVFYCREIATCNGYLDEDVGIFIEEVTGNDNWLEEVPTVKSEDFSKFIKMIREVQVKLRELQPNGS